MSQDFTDFTEFTARARELIRDAGERARSLGHRWIGCEHLLLALAANDGPAGEVLRGHGVTVPRIEKCILAMVGRGRGEGLFDSLDREALASVGIDLDTVRNTIERSFGPTAFRPLPAGPPRRLPHRFLPRLPRRRHRSGLFTKRARNTLSGAARAARSDRILVDVDHLALRLVTMHGGAVRGILNALEVSEARLADDLLNGLRRAS